MVSSDTFISASLTYGEHSLMERFTDSNFINPTCVLQYAAAEVSLKEFGPLLFLYHDDVVGDKRKH